MMQNEQGNNPVRQRFRLFAGILMLLAMTAAAYRPAMTAGFVWDDDTHVGVANVRTLGGIVKTWLDPRANQDYYPGSYTSWAIDYQLWGLDPLGYHVENILLHALNAILVWRILRRLAVPGAWVAAAVFAVHPVHVESVAWVMERKSVLSGLFALLAVWAFLSFALDEAAGAPSRRRWAFYGLSLALYLCAMFSKPMTMAVAAVLPLLVWWKRGRITWRDAAVVAPYFALAAPMAVLTAWVQNTHVITEVAPYLHTPLERVLIAGRVLVFYAGKLAWPADLMFAYPKWSIDTAAWWQYLYPGGAAAVIALLWLLRRRIGRAPLTGVLVFAVMLSPALGFFNVFWHLFYFVADHMQYLASLGLTALGVGAAAAAAARMGPWVRRAGCGAAALALGVLAVLTWQQCHIYKDAETLWTETLKKNPDSPLAHCNLGHILELRGKTGEAVAHYEAALRADPQYEGARWNLAIHHVNQAGACCARGQWDEAIAHCREALRLNPQDEAAYSALGVALSGKGLLAEAMDQYREALRLNPNLASAHSNLGLALAASGKVEEAVVQYREALRLAPESPGPYGNLGLALAKLGKTDEAIACFSQLLKLKPDDVQARLCLAPLLVAQGKTKEAIAQYQQALQLSPDAPQILAPLAWLYATAADPSVRNGAEAVRLAEHACRVTARKEVAPLDVLAAAYAEAGRFQDAVAAAREAAALARAQGQTDAATKIEARLRFYEAGKALRPAR